MNEFKGGPPRVTHKGKVFKPLSQVRLGQSKMSPRVTKQMQEELRRLKDLGSNVWKSNPKLGQWN